MELEDLCRRFKEDEITQEDFILELKRLRAFSKSDRFKLNAIDRAPFTLWASDSKNIIRYWECQCQVVYGHTAREAIGQNFLQLFVAEEERSQADIDAKKIIEGKEAPGEFCNNIAIDFSKMGTKVELMTNCFRVYDESSKEWLQAEIAIPTDLDKVIKKHAAIIADYERLKSQITEIKRDQKAFLETVSLKINELKTIATAMRMSRKKRNLSQDDKNWIDSFPNVLVTFLNDMTTSINESICSLEKASSINEFEQLESAYKQLKTTWNGQLTEWKLLLDELSEELNQANIKRLSDLSNKKTLAMDECDANADAIKDSLKQQTKDAYAMLRDPDNAPLNEQIKSRIQLFTSLSASVTQRLSSDKQKIENSQDINHVNKVLKDFSDFIENIELKATQTEGDAPR